MKLPVLLCAVLVVAGCTSATNDQSGGVNTTTTTTARSEPATTGSLRAECVDVADKATDLLAVVGRLATGEATVEQVRAATADLAESFDEAATAAGPEARAHLDEAGKALNRVEDALLAQPIDTAALRAAAGDLVTALGNAAGLCTPDSTTSTTTEETVTTIS
jgi:hypothetical protein